MSALPAAFPATIPQPVLDTALAQLTPLFLAASAGDAATSRDAAAHMLAAYTPETPDELSLASEIVSFSFQALEALRDATEPGLSMNKILRLRGSAVSLSREAHKAQRKLDQTQRARRAAPPQAEAEPASPTRQTTQPTATGTTTGDSIPAALSDKITWTQAYQHRLRTNRLAEKAQKLQARLAVAASRDAHATHHQPSG